MTTSRTLLIAVVLTSLAACKKEAPPSNPMSGSDVVEPAQDVPKHVQEMSANFQRVFFEFDSADMTDDSRAALADNAKIMTEHPDVKVEIQGHADERGTTDYNLALGSRRASALRDYLVAQGVAPSRVTVVSYGEERPLDARGGEVAWSKNRRGEFRVTWGDSVEGTIGN